MGCQSTKSVHIQNQVKHDFLQVLANSENQSQWHDSKLMSSYQMVKTPKMSTKRSLKDSGHQQPQESFVSVLTMNQTARGDLSINLDISNILACDVALYRKEKEKRDSKKYVKATKNQKQKQRSREVDKSAPSKRKSSKSRKQNDKGV